MGKEKSSEVKVLGWAIVISSILTILFNWFFPALKHTKFTLALGNLISAIAIFPRGLPLLFGKAGGSLIIYSIILSWTIFIIICGLGILRFNNDTRIVFIVLNIIHIITFAIAQILMRAYLNIGLFVFILIILTTYILYFTNSKVKELFK